MKRFVMLFLSLLLAACSAVPTTEPQVPVTGDTTPTSPTENPLTATAEAINTPTDENSLAGSAELSERIELGGGATSTQRSVLLPSGVAVKEYVVTIDVRQTMTVDVLTENVPLSMTIHMPSGMQVIPEMIPAEGGGYSIGHEFPLTEPGDYLITLTKADNTPSTRYTANFTIE